MGMSAAGETAINWLFIDMNSFFASVEQHLRPELRGRPVGVVPVLADGTCIIAASIDAKQHGIRTGTRVPEARQLCPGIELVEARPPVYVKVHHAVARTIERCIPIHKAYSIDEWAARLVSAERGVEAATELGRRIKRCILDDFSPWLTCSVGVAPTRLLAKIACDLHKPDGLTVLRVRDLPDTLEHMELQDLCGIAHGVASRLESNGVRTVRELWNLTRRQSVGIWGSVSGGHWWDGFHGVDEPEVPTRRHSMGHANVLEPHFRNEEGARAMLTRLVCRLGIRLRREGYLAGALSIEVLGEDRRHFSTGIELPAVQDTPTLLESLYTLWERRKTHEVPLRVGATVSGLVPASQTPGFLFPEADKGVNLSRAMDTINRRWGLSSAYFGSMHGCLHRMDEKIAFGRIPTDAESFGRGVEPEVV